MKIFMLVSVSVFTQEERFTELKQNSGHARSKICMHANFLFFDVSVIEIMLFN